MKQVKHFEGTSRGFDISIPDGLVHCGNANVLWKKNASIADRIRPLDDSTASRAVIVTASGSKGRLDRSALELSK